MVSFLRWNVPGPLLTCFRKYVLANSRSVVGVSFSGRSGAPVSSVASALAGTAIVNVFSRVPTFEFMFSVYGFFSRWNVTGPLLTRFRKYVLGIHVSSLGFLFLVELAPWCHWLRALWWSQL